VVAVGPRRADPQDEVHLGGSERREAHRTVVSQRRNQ
jgi:hypothetical protein